MVSAVGNRGDMQFMVFDGAMNVDIFKDFMERLAKETPGRAFLIVDNLKVHHAKTLEPWLEENKGRIRLFYLPSYSPELNPDEYLNQGCEGISRREKTPVKRKGPQRGGLAPSFRKAVQSRCHQAALPQERSPIRG